MRCFVTWGLEGFYLVVVLRLLRSDTNETPNKYASLFLKIDFLWEFISSSRANLEMLENTHEQEK